MKISSVHAREILDSRGLPTVEVDLILANGSFGRASVPSGTSTGAHEAVELRDGDSRYSGKGVLAAVNNINAEIKNNILNKDFDQASLDEFLIQLDGTVNKSRLGANAILAVSLAFAKAAAARNDEHLYEYISHLSQISPKIPTPMLNIMNGGAHAGWATDIQEFVIVPIADVAFTEKLRMGAEVFHKLGNIIERKGFSTLVGKEGGYAPELGNNEAPFELIAEAVVEAGYDFSLTGDIAIALDVAATEFFDSESGEYILQTEKKEMNSSDLIHWYEQLINEYPLVSIEDGFAEDDWEAWQAFNVKFADKLMIVGDDFLVTNPNRISKAIKFKAANALLAKVNQIGSLTEALQAIELAGKNSWDVIVSHRSGETEDSAISHLATGTVAGYIKTGAPSRGERTSKYNELLRIEEYIKRT